jgi:hypothetical protein
MKAYFTIPSGAASIGDTLESLEEEGQYNNRPVVRPSAINNPEMEPIHIGPPEEKPLRPQDNDLDEIMRRAGFDPETGLPM